MRTRRTDDHRGSGGSGICGGGCSAGRSACARQKACFTLSELLVVVPIIGILAALLLPALSRGKAQAHRVYCANNLRQIAVGLQLYVDDFHYYPAFQMPNSSNAKRTYFWDYKLL